MNSFTVYVTQERGHGKTYKIQLTRNKPRECRVCRKSYFSFVKYINYIDLFRVYFRPEACDMCMTGNVAYYMPKSCLTNSYLHNKRVLLNR